MTASNRSREIKSFQDLKDAIDNDKIVISSLPSKKKMANPGEEEFETTLPELPDLDEMERAIQAAEMQTEKISKEMTTIKEWLPQALKKIGELKDRLKTTPHGRIKKELEANLEKITEAVNTLLYHEEVEYRKAACRAYFNHAFSADPENTKQVLEIINDLYEKELLEEVPEDYEGAPFFLGRKKLILARHYGFDQEETNQILILFKEMLGRTKSHVQDDRIKRAEELKKQGKISLQDLLEGKNGLCCLEILPEGEYQGGILLIRAEREGIYPLDAVGGFEYAVREAAQMKIGKDPVFLKRSSIGPGKQPPHFGWMGKEKAAKFFLLWNLIQRVVKHEASRSLMLKEREEFRRQSTITPEEFFLEGKTGVVCVEFQGPWMREGRVVAENVFVLVDRSETETGTMISILAIPTHLQEREFFGELQLRVPYQEGEGFNRLPQPLKAVLQATYRQIKHSVEKTE